MKIKKLFYVGIFIISISLGKAQDFFAAISEKSIRADPKNRAIEPEKYLTYKLDMAGIKSYFNSVPELNDNELKIMHQSLFYQCLTEQKRNSKSGSLQ